MTTPIHFRYAWIAPATLKALLPQDGVRARTVAALGALQQAALGDIGDGDALQRLRSCAARPWAMTPTPRFCENALRFAERRHDKAGTALAQAALDVARLRDEVQDPSHASTVEEDAAVLNGFAATDFPVLMLWSAPAAARRLFTQDGARFQESLLCDARERRRTVKLALRYATAALGRVGPRDGWAGVGFGVTTETSSPGVVSRAQERLVIEPDLTLLAGFLDRPTIVPGDSAFDAAMRAADAPLREILRQAQNAVLDIQTEAWSFHAVDSFLRRTERMLPRREGRHGWWISRLCDHEITFPADLVDQAHAAYTETIVRKREVGLSQPGAMTRGTAWAMDIAQSMPDAVRLIGGELDDWIIEADAARAFGPPLEGRPSGALVVQTTGTGARFRFVELSPRRTSDRAAALCSWLPAYQTVDKAPGLAPPEGLFDNRLLRPLGEDYDLASCPSGIDAMFRATLFTDATHALFARQVASPRYATGPDIAPLFFCDRTALEVGFGAVDSAQRIWLLGADAARALANEVRTPAGLAAYFCAEIAAALGDPPWIDLISSGARARLPTRTVAGFAPALKALATANSPIAWHAPETQHANAPLIDDEGRALVADFYVPLEDMR